MNKIFITLFAILLIIFSSIAYISLINLPSQGFFELSIKGKNDSILLNSNSSIKVGEKIEWYFTLTSSFRTPKVVKIVIKLGNNKTSLPNDMVGLPSNGTEIYSWMVYLTYGLRKNFLFQWEITNVTIKEGYYYLTLNLNETLIKKIDNVGAYKGENFRMIIELWTLDQNGDFRIGWVFQNQLFMIWYQYPFNVTLTKK